MMFKSISQISILILAFILLFPTSLVIPTPANAQASMCGKEFIPVATPLTDLGSLTYTRMDGEQTNFTGGLYPGGSNTRPTAHEQAGRAVAAQIVPLDRDGNSDPVDGKIAMISIGMSNTNMEFARFMELADDDQEVNRQLRLINAALPGLTANHWNDPADAGWQGADIAVRIAGVTDLQVQVAWVKQTLTGGGNFPEVTLDLQGDLEAIVHILKDRYPNLKIAFFSSRTRSYTYFDGLSPEPLAYEGGFAVKWMIEKQINGDPELNYDSTKGAIKAPFLSWGPYLWIDGLNPRSDGIIWEASDLVVDCTHPSSSGVEKVANMLMKFFKNDTLTVNWFLANPPAQTLTSITPSPSPSPLPSDTPTPTQGFTPTPSNSPTASPPPTESNVALEPTKPEQAQLALEEQELSLMKMPYAIIGGITLCLSGFVLIIILGLWISRKRN